MWQTILTEAFLVGLFAAGIRIATPLLLTAIGELISEKAGVLNIGLEGMMLAGSLAGFLGAFYLGNTWAGMLIGMLAGSLISLIHAFLSITLHTDQVVNGIALNIFSWGITSLIFQVIFGITTIPPKVQPLGHLDIPLLSQIPFLGPVLFQQSPLVYITLLIVILSWIAIFKTDFGLSLRAVGEQPFAADTAGINVTQVRYLAIAITGLLAGLGGAFLSVAQLGAFSDNMTAGRGFIALAVVIFGRWTPQGALLASLLFGISYALQLSLQALGFNVPYQLLLMLPYVLTILALAGAAGRRGAPQALGLPYKKA